jgi:adenosine/AMP kinase
MALEVESIGVEKPEDVNIILGQAHFIKTVDDLHEAITQLSPKARFGIAFCEASGPRLVRRSGTDDEMIAVAVRIVSAIGAGHSFAILLRDVYPASVLNAIKTVPEVACIFCATANPVEVIVARSELGSGIVGVIDGSGPLGVEAEPDVAERRTLLKRLGYKL